MFPEEVLNYLTDRIALIKMPHPVRVAIDGIDAAGKTTLANQLAERLKASGRVIIRTSTDNFHHPREIRYRKGADSATGYYHDSFDYQAILTQLLIPLGPGGNHHMRTCTYDYLSDKPVEDECIEVLKDAILLFDGLFLMRPELYSNWDFRIFIEIDFETCLARALDRDIALFGSTENITHRYRTRYFPAQRLYLDNVKPQALADVIVENNHIWNTGIHILSE
jgi:uridine kinase